MTKISFYGRTYLNYRNVMIISLRFTAVKYIEYRLYAKNSVIQDDASVCTL